MRTLLKTVLKTVLISLFTFAFIAAAPADEPSAKLSDVHLCCQGCVEGAEKAVAKVKGVTAKVDQDDESVTLTASDKASIQKAVDALVAAGYFGKSDQADIKVANDPHAKGEKVQTLKIEGVHLCCGKCVAAVGKAVRTVPGVSGHTAKKNAETFEVTGDFNDKEVFDALQKAGLAGHVAK